VSGDDRAGVLLETQADPDPLVQFRRWYADAEAAGVRAPHAMALATATPDGSPSLRMVLLKEVTDGALVFYTGYGSRKAAELEGNPHAALLFYWDPLGRQVRIEGAVERISPEESDAYFATRPRGAQLAATASRQGAPLESRAELDDRFVTLERELEGRDVPRPEDWGGYRVVPDAFEFWQHRENRLHDRLRYRPADHGWIVERLSP
jgi:pyridoxamine 5'-phosphate oxidase